jgi:hypothetical protein
MQPSGRSITLDGNRKNILEQMQEEDADRFRETRLRHHRQEELRPQTMTLTRNRSMRLRILLLTFALSVTSAQFTAAQGSLANQPECAAALARAANDPKIVVREGLLGACGRSSLRGGHGPLADAARKRDDTDDPNGDYKMIDKICGILP